MIRFIRSKNVRGDGVTRSVAARASVIVALLSLGSAACAPVRQAIADVDGVARRASKAVWRVEANGCAWKSRGSAFAIDARHLITNRHVVANDSSPVVRLPDGTSRAGKVIGASSHPDVAVIEVAKDLPAHLRWAPTSSLATREPLVVIGYPSPAHLLKVTTGRIVNFQGPAGVREAALINAPIARGNSGGPALRGDASVAGVVTQMAVQSGERVAILFTADALRATVATFMRRPVKVLSSCGLGPDYVPPVPKTYDITRAPPTAEPIGALPVPAVEPTALAARRTPVPRPAKTATPVTAAPCPRGAPGSTVTELTATEQEDQPSSTWWKIDARGFVRNDTSSPIVIQAIDIRIDGDPPITRPAGRYSTNLRAGQQTEWVFEDQYVYSPGNRPTRADVTVSWYWPDRSECPSGTVTRSGPDPTPAPSPSPQG